MTALEHHIDLHLDPDKSLGPISPLLFGQFIENMYDCIDPGLHAQLLQSRGFENPDDNGDGVSDPWVAVGEGVHSLDSAPVLAPSRSQHLRHTGTKAPCGVAQGELLLLEHETYAARFWVYAEKAARVEAAVTAQDDGRTLYQGAFSAMPGRWVRHSFRLRAAHRQRVRFSLSVCDGAEVWLDQTALTPESAVARVWPDVYGYIRSLRPSVIRFPGGCFADSYHWEDGIGPVDSRPARPNGHWGGVEDNAFGTDEFLALCRELDCAPMICVNFGSGTPEEAAHWVEYCNGPADSPYGARRAANGHPAPYGVRYWDIGNEAFADWEIGHCDAAEYCARFTRFAEAMTAVDPGIELIACGGDGNSADQAWNATLSREIGHLAAYLGIHNYTPLTGEKYPDAWAQYYAVAGAPVQYEKRLRETARVIQSQGRLMKLAVTEWNCNYQDGSEREQTMEAAVCNAGMLHAFFRLGEQVPIAMISDLVNGWDGGIIRSRHGMCYGTPTYHVLCLYAQAAPRKLLGCKYAAPCYGAEAVGNLEKADEIPVVDVVACGTADGGRCLFVVNRDLEARAVLHLPRGLTATAVTTIAAADFTAANTWNSETVVPREVRGVWERLDIAPCSVTRVTLA